MKRDYITAELEIVLLDKEDIIATSAPTTSGLINGGVGTGDSGKFEDLFPGL